MDLSLIEIIMNNNSKLNGIRKHLKEEIPWGKVNLQGITNQVAQKDQIQLKRTINRYQRLRLPLQDMMLPPRYFNLKPRLHLMNTKSTIFTHIRLRILMRLWQILLSWVLISKDFKSTQTNLLTIKNFRIV